RTQTCCRSELLPRLACHERTRTWGARHFSSAFGSGPFLLLRTFVWGSDSKCTRFVGAGIYLHELFLGLRRPFTVRNLLKGVVFHIGQMKTISFHCSKRVVKQLIQETVITKRIPENGQKIHTVLLESRG